MHDRLNLIGRYQPSAEGCHDHRCLDRRLFACKRALLGLSQMNPGVLDGPDLGDALGQLLLNGSPVARLLHELTRRQGRLILQRLQDAAPLIARNALGCKQDARFVVAARGHHQLARGDVDLGIVIGRLERIERGLLVGLGHAGKYRTVRRLLSPGIDSREKYQSDQHEDSRHRLANGRLSKYLRHGGQHTDLRTAYRRKACASQCWQTLPGCGERGHCRRQCLFSHGHNQSVPGSVEFRSAFPGCLDPILISTCNGYRLSGEAAFILAGRRHYTGMFLMSS